MLRLDPAQDGSCSVNQQFTKIDIAKFADPEEPRFADCRVFAGDEAEPVRQLAALLNCVTWVIAAMRGVAVTGPIPGMVCSR
jgi:hypothetical protein